MLCRPSDSDRCQSKREFASALVCTRILRKSRWMTRVNISSICLSMNEACSRPQLPRFRAQSHWNCWNSLWRYDGNWKGSSYREDAGAISLLANKLKLFLNQFPNVKCQIRSHSLTVWAQLNESIANDDRQLQSPAYPISGLDSNQEPPHRIRGLSFEMWIDRIKYLGCTLCIRGIFKDCIAAHGFKNELYPTFNTQAGIVKIA
jgi:hypothetical protein